MGDYGGGGYGGAFGGGGFVPEQGGGGGGGGGKGEKSQKPEAVIPVTIKALTEAVQRSTLDDTTMIYGHELGNLTLVAKLVRVQDTATQMTYTVDDGTGKLDLKMWVDSDDSEAAQALKAELRPGSYVRAFGSLRLFQGSKSVVAYSLRPVTDHNEVTFHLLEAAYVSKQLAANQPGMPSSRTSFGGGAAALAPPAHGAYAPQGGAGPPGRTTGDVGADVLAVFNSDLGRGDNGVSLDVVEKQLGGRYNSAAIKAAVEAAVNDGSLYSTLDERHFKSTSY